MHLIPPSALRDRRILIVESEPPLLRKLMRAMESEGGETAYVTDPYSDAGATRIGAFTYCAAAINSVHRSVAKMLDVPILIYGATTNVPAEVGAIVRALKGMLAGRP